MKRLAFGMIMLSMLVLGTAWAAQDTIRLQLDLVDGSRLVGSPSIESVPVQTAYAKMDIPLKQIITLKIAEDHETVSIDLQNGDKIKGVINLEPIKLETVFGKVSVGIGQIREIDIVLSGKALPEGLTKGLVLYYSFDKDEGAKVTDRSASKNNGDVRGAKWTAKGKAGGAYSFNGRDASIRSTGYKGVTGSNPRTIALWFKTTQAANNIAMLFYGGWGVVKGDGVWMGMSFGPANMGLPNLQLDGGQVVNGAKAANDGNWHQAVFIYDGTKARFFVDSSLVGELNEPAVNTDTTYDVLIGTYGGGGYNFDGLMDEIMIFDRALSDSEVKQIYDVQK